MRCRMRRSLTVGYAGNEVSARLALLAACICTLSVAGIAAPKAHYEFRFNPPSGTTYTAACKSTKVIDIGPAGKRVDVTTSRERVMITKTDSGYSAAFETLSTEMTRNGERLPTAQNAAMQAITQLPLTLRLDASGRLTAIDGIEGVQKAVDAMLQGPDQASADRLAELRESMKAGIVSGVTAEWNNRIVDFVGKTADCGDVWVGQGETESPFGKISLAVKTYFGNPVVMDRHNCMKLGFSYASDQKSIKQFMANVMGMVAKSARGGMPTAKVIGAAVIGKGYRIVDPSTMLIYSEELHRTLTMTMRLPTGGDVISTYSESRVYSYDYTE